MIVVMTAVGDAQDATMIVVILVIIFLIIGHLASSHILLYIEIKRDVRHPWPCQRCDDDGY